MEGVWPSILENIDQCFINNALIQCKNIIGVQIPVSEKQSSNLSWIQTNITDVAVISTLLVGICLRKYKIYEYFLSFSNTKMVQLFEILSHELQPWRVTWWCHQMETFSALLAICAGNSLVSGEFPEQRPVTWSFDVFFDLRLNKRLCKQSWGWWFEMPWCPLWHHCNELSHLTQHHITFTS